MGADKKPKIVPNSPKAKAAKKPMGELTKADLEKVTVLDLQDNQLTDVKGLEKLTQLTFLNLYCNHLTTVKGLVKLTNLKYLDLGGNRLADVKGLVKLTGLRLLVLNDNPDLTKAQIAELKKASKFTIRSNPTK